MIDLRPLASYLANEYGLDYLQMLDTLFDFFMLNEKYNGFFIGVPKLHNGDPCSVDDILYRR